jgi:hypothetical protein
MNELDDILIKAVVNIPICHKKYLNGKKVMHNMIIERLKIWRW